MVEAKAANNSLYAQWYIKHLRCQLNHVDMQILQAGPRKMTSNRTPDFEIFCEVLADLVILITNEKELSIEEIVDQFQSLGHVPEGETTFSASCQVIFFALGIVLCYST